VVWKADSAVGKNKVYLFPWFSVAREKRQSQPRLNAERQNFKSHAVG
jgi:hypothetical protein